jgi:sugar phosphate isomerase/epimerase
MTVITTNADYVRFPQFKYCPDRVNFEPDGADIVRAVPFGTGFIDYEAFFKGLREGGFDGISTYEMCSPLRGGGSLDNLDRCAKQFIDWNRERGLIGP